MGRESQSADRNLKEQMLGRSFLIGLDRATLDTTILEAHR